MEPINTHSIAQPPPNWIIDDTDAPTSASNSRRPSGQFQLHSPAVSLLPLSSAMSSDGDAREAASAPEPTNPFNFKTQVISSSLAKSVCHLDPLSVRFSTSRLYPADAIAG